MTLDCDEKESCWPCPVLLCHGATSVHAGQQWTCSKGLAGVAKGGGGTRRVSNGCVDAYEAALAVQQHTPRVARVDGCVCLDDITYRYAPCSCTHMQTPVTTV